MNPPPTLRFVEVGSGHFLVIAHLAQRIWPISFADIISPTQCEYMLRQRYTPQALAEALARGMRYELIEIDGKFVGFGAHGPSDNPVEWKLWQLYVLPEHQGLGIGRSYIENVSAAARHAGRSALVLTVNKRNDRARVLYEKSGFHIRESAHFDIGNGFVMDDYVMVRPLHALAP